MSDQDPFSDDDDDQSSVIQKIRDQLKTEQAEKKKALRELQELQTFKATIEGERKTQQVGEVFTGIGLSAAAAKLALKDRPDQEWDPDNAREWAQEYGWQPTPAEPEPVVEAGPPPPPQFSPTPAVGDKGNNPIDRDEYLTMLQSRDQGQQAEALRLMQAGLVQ